MLLEISIPVGTAKSLEWLMAFLTETRGTVIHQSVGPDNARKYLINVPEKTLVSGALA